METGSRGVSGDMLERVLQAADYRPAVPLSEQASSIRDVASRLGFSRLRVLALRRVVRITSGATSTLMVTAGPGTDLLALALLSDEIERLTGFRTDIVDDTRARELMPQALAEAVPL